jgi:rRNA processing protein Gar1
MFNQIVHNASKNGQEIGKIDEVFGPQNSSWFSVTPSQGVKLDGF